MTEERAQSDVRHRGFRGVASNELRAQAIVELEVLAHAIDGPVMVWSNEVLAQTAAAGDAIRFCGSRGDVILGVEGFDTDGTNRIARMDCIADFSTLEETRTDAVGRSANAAISVLGTWSPTPHPVTFVLRRSGQD